MAGDAHEGERSDDVGTGVGDDVETDVALVRTVLARELDTINEYEALARRAKNPTLKAFFRHLALEEKEHVAEAMALIRAFDAEQESKSTNADVRPEHFSTGAAAAQPSSRSGAGAGPTGAIGSGPIGSGAIGSGAIGSGGRTTGGRTTGGGLTVGSLKGIKGDTR